MNPIAAFAETALRQHPDPALRLGELVEMVARRVDHSLNRSRLRSILESYPDRFRILDPWRGPWRSVGAGSEDTPVVDVWVIAIGESGAPPGGTPAAAKLRESVRWLGRGIDARSSRDVSRWYAIALAERSIRASVSRRAA